MTNRRRRLLYMERVPTAEFQGDRETLEFAPADCTPWSC